MADAAKRPLKVFLCHASGDKLPVREIYRRLVAEGVDVWLDEENIMPGQDWQLEIPRAVREADVVVACLSNKSITKEGYIQKELKYALDRADEKPEDTIFLIPARLEDCVVPPRLSRWQWVDLFEEHGFARLLRSLKLRAENAGATIQPPGEESGDQEAERKLDHLYTEGLAAFYTEDWDRAYQRFQAILRERPSHKNAAEKLAQAEQQRNFVKLYAQATQAYEVEDWPVAIRALEELLGTAGDYRDADRLLKDARKQRKLKELYLEVQRLHAAQKWHAVIKVFDQIVGIDSAYPDPEGLLVSAQKEAAELKRLADLDDLYRQGVHKMDAGEWYEAREVLEQVHKAQTGFRDTERLLRKVENEILRIEELTKRSNQINTLYEQAHGLIRSKSWRTALDKMEEIRKLDEQFVDKDEIFEKARRELEREEEGIQRQNELATMYAEAVRLLKEGKPQKALDQWHKIKTLDPKYPDRQKVQATARKSLQSPPKHRVGRVKIPTWGWILISLVILVGGLSVSYMLYDQSLAAIRKHSCTQTASNVVEINSKWKQAPVLIDGKITYGSEWSDALCTSFRIYQGGNTELSDYVDSQWYIKNDGEWLYILRRTPKTFAAENIFVGYYYPYPYTDRWQNSDGGGYSLGAKEPFDVYGWDEIRFYDDVEADPPGTLDVQAASTQADDYIWFEMRKRLNSGDGYDWTWKPGTTVGTDKTGNLIFGGRGRGKFYAHPILLVLAAPKQE